jgi:predicted amidohydrolase YtcJ
MIRPFALALLALLTACESVPHSHPADRLFVGTVVTMDPDQPLAEAVAVRDGRIIAVGTERELKHYIGAETWITDLEEGALLPGFIDPHSHFLQAGQVSTWANVSSPPAGPVTDIARLLDELTHTAQGAVEWLIGYGYDPDQLPGGHELTRHDLDARFGDRLVMVIHVSGHGGVFSTAGLRAVGIDSSTPTPPGGVIVREGDTDEPAGLLMENAFIPAFFQLPRPTREAALAGIDLAEQLYLERGITTANEGATDAAGLELLDAANEGGLLTLDVVALPLSMEATKLIGRRDFTRYRGKLRLGGIKFIIDGSPQGKTAFFTEPFLNGGPGGEADWRGEPNIDQDELSLLVRHCAVNEVRIFAHCNGDAAIDMLLAALDALPDGVVADRPVVIHSQFVRRDQLERYAELGVVPSYFTNHAFYWGDVHRANLGDDRAAFLSPCATSAELGIRFTNHTDYMVTPLDPMFTLWTATQREERSGAVLGPDERISVDQALRAITIDAAYQFGEEAEKGSIEVGKRADLIVLSANPLERSGDELRKLQVWATYKDGRLLYELDGRPLRFFRQLADS